MMLVPSLIFVIAACLTLITMMLPEDSSENDDGRGHPTSLRRALLFVLLGPVLGVLVAYYLAGEGYRDGYVIPIAYFFSLIVCATTGPIDGILAHVAPIWLRGPLTANFVGNQRNTAVAHAGPDRRHRGVQYRCVLLADVLFSPQKGLIRLTNLATRRRPFLS
jgi:MFS family permease